MSRATHSDVTITGYDLGDAKRFDTEPLDDIDESGASSIGNRDDTVYQDTEVLDDIDDIEEAHLLDGFETEVVPDSDDELMDSNPSKRLSCRTGGFVDKVVRELNQVMPHSRPLCGQQRESSSNVDVCCDEQCVSGQATDVCKGNDFNPVIVQSELQATELHVKEVAVCEVKHAVFDSVSCHLNSGDDSKQLSEDVKVDENGKISQLKTRRISIVYTRKRCRTTCKFEEKGQQEEKRTPSKCNDHVGLSYVDSQEPVDLSKALLFVDQYVSVHAMHSSPVMDVNIKEKSPPSLLAKGAQSLVRWASVRDRTGKSGLFVWDPCDGLPDSVLNNSQLSSRSKKHDKIYVRRSPKVTDMMSKEHGNASMLQKERAVDGDKRVELKKLINSDTKQGVSDYKSDGDTEQVREKKTREDFDVVLDLQLNGDDVLMQLEAGTIHTDSEHVFDVGTNTQMAAEAMQALSFAAPAGCTEMHADQCSRELLYSSSRQVWSSCKRTRSASRRIENQKKHRKYSCSDDRVDVRQASELEVRKNTGKVVTDERLNEKSFGSSGKVKFTSKKTRAKRVCTKGSKENSNSLISDIDKSLHKMKCQKKHADSYPLAGNLIPSSLFNMNEGLMNERRAGKIELVNIGPDDQRKQVSVTDDMLELSDQSENFPKLFYKKSRNSRNGRVNKEGKTCQLVDDMGNTKASQEDTRYVFVRPKDRQYILRDYPRGKRTCRNTLGPSGSSDLDNSSAKLSNSHHFFHSSSFGCNMKKKRRSSVYISPCSSSSQKSCDVRLQRQCVNKPICVIGGNDSKQLTENTISLHPLTENAMPLQPLTENTMSMQLDKTCNVGSVSTVNGTWTDGPRLPPNKTLKPHDTNKSGSPNGSCLTNEVNLTDMINGCHKQPGQKLSSPLARELVRLGLAESMPEFTSKDSRRRKTMANIQVLLSQNMDKGTLKQQKKILVRLGVPMASSASDATHFVADKFARTRNMLEFIAQGKPIVTHMWLESCEQAGLYIDERNHILRDAKKELELGFRLPNSLAQARQRPLLKGYRVFITPNTRPEQEVLSSLVKASHGQVADVPMDSTSQDKTELDDLLILSCEEDRACCVPFLQKGASVYSPELLLNGIIIQKLEFERYSTLHDNIHH